MKLFITILIAAIASATALSFEDVEKQENFNLDNQHLELTREKRAIKPYRPPPPRPPPRPLRLRRDVDEYDAAELDHQNFELTREKRAIKPYRPPPPRPPPRPLRLRRDVDEIQAEEESHNIDKRSVGRPMNPPPNLPSRGRRYLTELDQNPEYNLEELEHLRNKRSPQIIHPTWRPPPTRPPRPIWV